MYHCVRRIIIDQGFLFLINESSPQVAINLYIPYFESEPKVIVQLAIEE
jgi:hypothetical protein